MLHDLKEDESSTGITKHKGIDEQRGEQGLKKQKKNMNIADQDIWNGRVHDQCGVKKKNIYMQTVQT